MGYGFIGQRTKDSQEESLFYTSCMYSYQPIFRKCFGKEITEFSGRVTKLKLQEFKDGVIKFNSPEFNLDDKQMRGYIDNINHEELSQDLLKLCKLMDSGEVKYLSIM